MSNHTPSPRDMVAGYRIATNVVLLYAKQIIDENEDRINQANALLDSDIDPGDRGARAAFDSLRVAVAQDIAIHLEEAFEKHMQPNEGEADSE